MHIREPFRNLTGIIAGNATQVARKDIERLDGLFAEEAWAGPAGLGIKA
jgi:hypothetical protein